MPNLPESCVGRREEHLRFSFPEGDGAPFMALSLAAAGNMSWKDPEGQANRRHYYRRLGLRGRVHAQYQDHTRKVAETGTASLRTPPVQRGDGLILANDGDFLSVTAADCMPVWIWNRETGRIALLHSGWKGTGILADALDLMKSPGGARMFSVLLGPSIGSCCYRVDEERYRLFRERWGDASVRREDGVFYLSLLDANLRIAAEYGLEYCYAWSPCTVCNREFGSFRREGSENFTSMLALSGYFK
jgi:purine-nucleoside/S-methyl-5'-thioadenosine phosphorylase / adenosine deaminase